MEGSEDNSQVREMLKCFRKNYYVVHVYKTTSPFEAGEDSPSPLKRSWGGAQAKMEHFEFT